MTYAVVLGLHIAAACLTIGVIVGALYALLGSSTKYYSLYASVIGALAMFEVVSGTLLAILSPTISVLQLVSHMTAYLIVCVAVELLLYERMRRPVWIS